MKVAITYGKYYNNMMAEDSVTITIDDINKLRAEKQERLANQAKETFDLALKVVNNEVLSDEELSTLLKDSLAMEGMGISESEREDLDKEYKKIYQDKMNEKEANLMPDRRLYKPSLAALEVSLKHINKE